MLPGRSSGTPHGEEAKTVTAGPFRSTFQGENAHDGLSQWYQYE